MDDTDSLAAFQNPATTMNPGDMEKLANDLKTAEVVQNAHVPSLDSQIPQSAEIGPYGKLIKSGPSPEEIQRANEKEEREHIISRLTRLNHKPNFPTISFNPHTDSLHTLRRLNRLATHAGRLKMSVSFMKRATIFFCRLIEGLTQRFPVLKKYGLNLEGFSEHLMLTINSFDSVLEDLYDYYSDTIVECSPLLIYIGSIGSQMMVYSATKTIMAKTQEVAAKKRAAEQKKRDDEIAELMRARLGRQKMSGPLMSGPDEVHESELVDNASVGFQSVVSTEAPKSPTRSVRFEDEEKKKAEESASKSEAPKVSDDGRVVVNIE